MLLQPDCFLGRIEALTLSALLSAVRGGLPHLLLTLRVGLLALRLGLSLTLRLLTVALDPLLAFLRRDFVLQALALEFDLGLLFRQLRLVLALFRFAGLAGRLGLGVNWACCRRPSRARSSFPTSEPATSLALPASAPTIPPAVRSGFS